MSTLRKRIADAAQELYLRDGLDGFSMRKVAEIVGVSAPALYRHYENKDELLDEIVLAGLKTLERYLKPALEAPTPLERLIGMTDRYLEFALEQPKYFDFAFLVPSRSVDRFADEITKLNWVTFKLAIEQVGECVERGELGPGDPMQTAILVWSQAHGLVTLFRTGRFGAYEAQFRLVYRASIRRLLDALKPAPAVGTTPAT